MECKMNKNDQNILNENSTEEVVAVEGETEGSINIDEQSYKVSD